MLLVVASYATPAILYYTTVTTAHYTTLHCTTHPSQHRTTLHFTALLPGWCCSAASASGCPTLTDWLRLRTPPGRTGTDVGRCCWRCGGSGRFATCDTDAWCRTGRTGYIQHTHTHNKRTRTRTNTQHTCMLVHENYSAYMYSIT